MSDPVPHQGAGIIALHVFLAGLLSIVVQVILLRELSAAFYGVDLVYLLGLGAWLLWTAAGALLGRRALRPSALRLGALYLAIGAVVPLDVALVRRSRLLLGGVPGAFLPLPEQVAASVFCLLPASVLLGVLFQWAAKRYLPHLGAPCAVRGAQGGVRGAPFAVRGAQGGVRGSQGAAPDDARHPTIERRSLARAYAIESAGGIAGGLVATATLHWGVSNVTLAIAIAALAFVAATGQPGSELRASSTVEGKFGACKLAGVIRATALCAALVCLVACWNSRRLDLWTTSWNHPDVIDVVDSPWGRLTITQRAGQVSAYENDALTIESEGTEPEDFAHLSMIQHASPRRVLLVSGAAAGLLATVAEHRPDRIDDLDLNDRLVTLLERHLPGAFARTRASPAVRVIFDDPRHAMRLLRETYDVVIVAAAEPASAQANRFFTRDFFEQCAARLAAGGVVAFRLSSIENLWTPPLIARTGSIYAALREVFSDVVVLPGSTNVVLASRSPLTRDPAILAERLERRGIHGRLVTPRYVRYLYSNDRYAEIEQILRRHPARPNTDANAASYQATSLLWLSKFAPSLAGIDLARVADIFGWSRIGSWLVLAAAVAVALGWRAIGWPRRSLLVALAAFGGMMLETLLLVHYQLKNGVIFQDLGLLLMSVMAGLACGAWLVDRHARPSPDSPRPARARFTVLPIVVAAFVALAFGAAMAVRTSRASGLLPVSAMLFAAGSFVAAVFAMAAGSEADQRRLVSPLYAADVLGGAVGCVACSLLFIPLLGLPATAEWTAALMAAALILA